MRLLSSGALTALFLVAACSTPTAAPPAPQDPPARMTESKSLPAPAIPGAVRRITVADAGKTVSVPVGDTFQIELVGVPTAGYLWAVKTAPAFLEKTTETGGDTTTAQRQPGFAGGNHWEVFAFRATTAGTGEVLLEQRRPWEKDEPATNSFRVTIQAQ